MEHQIFDSPEDALSADTRFTGIAGQLKNTLRLLWRDGDVSFVPVGTEQVQRTSPDITTQEHPQL